MFVFVVTMFVRTIWMNERCHTNNILHVNSWGCVVVQVMCHALMTQPMTQLGKKGLILKLSQHFSFYSMVTNIDIICGSWDIFRTDSNFGLGFKDHQWSRIETVVEPISQNECKYHKRILRLCMTKQTSFQEMRFFKISCQRYKVMGIIE